ncbi:MAG: formylmethanofuran dehydrogenase [Candidatus Desulforudis sp.]|nr:formylmethanofuran dehydrogenase [Desulforudis sp.]MBV1736029.1 formylmethanofuran dehydrogenase [Desulforudis sp.]MBV1769591.1 formylmethanofuran dehydrogenase [Desulforudis sp.]
MCMQTPWERALEFHGHVCPGLVIGFRAAERGLRELGIDGLNPDNLVVIAENQSCAVDAIQVVTGCTLGKGSLELRDYGKHVYSFVCRDTGEAVRVALRFTALGFAAGLQELREDFLREPSAENERILTRRREAIADQLMEMPEEELWEISSFHSELPSRPRVLPSLCCARCGEGVMESRARLAKGQVVCLPCLKRGV